MSGDDDTVVKHKLLADAEALGKKPLTLNVWVVIAIALVAFAAGAIIF